MKYLDTNMADFEKLDDAYHRFVDSIKFHSVGQTCFGSVFVE